MKRQDFHIGLEFWCGGKQWCCTDVGTRVIAAICLEPHEVVSVEVGKDAPDSRHEQRHITDDPSWFVGPPYAVTEEVFDENSIKACSLSPS